MPSSVSGRLISGSCTVARAAVTASSAGEPVSVSDMVLGLSPSTGDRAPGRRRATAATCAHGSPATVRRRARRPPGRRGDLLRRPVGLHAPSAPVPPGASADRAATLRDAIGLGIAVGLYGTAFGAAAADAGLSPLQALAMSLLMFTGASQFALVGVLGAGGGALAAALGSALLLGTRNTVYAVRLVPLLSPRGAAGAGSRPAHWVIDETTALALAAPDRALARLGVPRRRRDDLHALERDHARRCARRGRPGADGEGRARRRRPRRVPRPALAAAARGFPEAGGAAAGRARRRGRRPGADAVRARRACR